MVEDGLEGGFEGGFIVVVVVMLEDCGGHCFVFLESYVLWLAFGLCGLRLLLCKLGGLVEREVG